MLCPNSCVLALQSLRNYVQVDAKEKVGKAQSIIPAASSRRSRQTATLFVSGIHKLVTHSIKSILLKFLDFLKPKKYRNYWTFFVEERALNFLDFAFALKKLFWGKSLIFIPENRV